jgi:putative transposase
MPDHVHLFCSPRVVEAPNVNTWAAYWKGLISRGIRGYGPLAADAQRFAADGVEAVPPREGKPERSGSPGGPAEVSLWQRDVWDTQLRDGEHYHEKWDYVRMNPVRKELVSDPDDWPFQGEVNVLFW